MSIPTNLNVRDITYNGNSVPLVQTDLSNLASVVGGGVTATEAAIRGALNDLIDDANDATSESDATMTAAVQSLIDGYGGGGSSFDYDIIEYTVTTGSSYNGTTYTIPHGLSYTPTWFVAVQTPQNIENQFRMYGWFVLPSKADFYTQGSTYSRHVDSPSDDPANKVGYCDENNIYLVSRELVFSNVTAGSTIYIITKDTGV